MGIRAAASGGAARRALSASLCRARSSSPSEGSAAWHHVNQETLIAQAFDLRTPEAQPSLVLSKQA